MIINGIEYELKETAPRQKNSNTGTLLKLAALSMMMGGYSGVNNYSSPAPKVNLKEEFELIQNKKSKLSRADREWVVYQFNRLYKIKQT